MFGRTPRRAEQGRKGGAWGGRPWGGRPLQVELNLGGAPYPGRMPWKREAGAPTQLLERIDGLANGVPEDTYDRSPCSLGIPVIPVVLRAFR